jgi:pimeloyl-ACP methyl ester carboxylesterase
LRSSSRASLRLAAFLALAFAQAAVAQALSGIGVVVMHGKSGSPSRHVAPLAASLADKGAVVANLEMPWSGNRQYDVDVAAAEKEVASALDVLRGKGAKKVFVAGHSQGGLFALHAGGRLPVDGVIAIAPGGNVAGRVFVEKLGTYLSEARRLAESGKGQEKTRLFDYEGSHGLFPVVAVPAAYVTWFDPEGAMNQARAARAVRPDVPVLYVAPKRDYPALMRLKQPTFDALPRHALTRLFEPDSGHLDAPATAADEIARWIADVAGPR